MNITDAGRTLSTCLLALNCLWASSSAVAQPAPSTSWNPNPWLDYWSFRDTNTWQTDLGYPAVSFTNLGVWAVADWNAVVVDDSTNAAWLQYNVWEADGTTNLTVDVGSVAMWFAPSSWSSQDQGGTGPQCWAPLIETGAYTTNSAYGWWSLCIDPSGSNILFSAQDGNGNETNYITAPFSWASNLFHCVVLTYSSTNTALYIDGNFVTNGPGVTIYPSPDVLSNGFWLGSDCTGSNQCHGILGDISTYNYTPDAGTIDGLFVLYEVFYLENPVNALGLTQAPSQPQTSPVFDVVTGPGYLVATNTNTSGCVNNSNVWMTNTTATLTTNGVNLTFTIAGGTNGLAYDVFATAALTQPLTNGVWTWMGQGYPCVTYTLLDLTNSVVLLLLGTPFDPDNKGLTYAYEMLVSHTDPYVVDSLPDGMPDAWKVLEGLSTTDPNLAGEDPDGDGLLNYQEYLYGTNPKVSEGFNVWVSEPEMTSGIP
jgi:hypothetical protein